MKKILKYAIAASVLTAVGCKKDSEFLDVLPTSIITNELAFSNSANVLSVLGDLYNRQVDFSTLEDWYTMADFSESFPSENGRNFLVQRNGWDYGEWRSWDYTYIRLLNLFLERLEVSTQLSAPDKARFNAEGRFLRANYYFEITKRMGGVPLILNSLTYNFDNKSDYLQFPRSKEAEIYDFVISEADAIKASLPSQVDGASSASRASKGAAMAMKCRAALYAASIAKYGATTPQVSLPGGEVGIPAAMATDYYTKALNAAKEIISGSVGGYALYNKKPDLADNFASIFIDKANNSEMIFVEDYKLKSGKVHYFTGWNQPRYGAEEEEGGRINPSLNLVESFEKLDNTFAPIPINDAGGNPIYYTNQTDPFAGRDARLAGTVMLPGSFFKGRQVDIWNGLILSNNAIFSGDERGQQKPLPGTTAPLIQVVGFDGPVAGKEFSAQSGFYLRKYLDPAIGSGSRGTNSELPFIRYRYAEVLLNAAEAAFELGDKAAAAGYMNPVRARAGLTIPLAAADITFDRIVHERRAELSFEGHILFDHKRWRIAHQVWDGAKMTEADLLSNIGKATKRNTQPYGLWPYKYYNPGSPNHLKWVYKIVLPIQVTGANNFQFPNYYSFIDGGVLSNNPKLVKQPFQ